MTDAQWKVESQRITDNVNYELRKFRKKCVTQGVVTFFRDTSLYQLRYRGRFVCYLYGHYEEGSKLRAAWNIIRIAEEIIE